VTNPGFECGLLGWQVLEGQGRNSSSAWEGSSALELTTDPRGFARIATMEPIAVTTNATLCVAVNARGTVPVARLEVLVTPSNIGTSFAAPVADASAAVLRSGIDACVESRIDLHPRVHFHPRVAPCIHRRLRLHRRRQTLSERLAARAQAAHVALKAAGAACVSRVAGLAQPVGVAAPTAILAAARRDLRLTTTSE
jgi:hypothetical protein